MLDERGIRDLLPRPRGTSAPTITTTAPPYAPTSTDLPGSLGPSPGTAPAPIPPLPTTAQGTDSALQGAVQVGEDRFTFSDPAEKVTYDAVTSAPGQDPMGQDPMGDGAGLGAGLRTTPAPDVVYDLSTEEKDAAGGWNLWIIAVAVLVAILLCIGLVMFRGGRARPAQSYGGGYGAF